jgi:hypothetical protein
LGKIHKEKKGFRMKQCRNIITSFLMVLIIAGCTNSIYMQKDVNVKSTASATPMSTNTKTITPSVTIAPTNTMTPKEAVEATARAIPVNNNYCAQENLATIIKSNKLPEEDVRSRNIYINKEKVENVDGKELAAILFCQWLELSSDLDGYRVIYLEFIQPKGVDVQVPDNYYIIIYYSVLPTASQNRWREQAIEITPDGWIIKRPIVNSIFLLENKYYLEMIMEQ